MKAQRRRASPGRVVAFPSRAVIEAVHALERNAGPEIDELATSILVLALQRQEPVPSWTVTLLISVMVRNVGRPLAAKLAGVLLAFVEDFEVLVVGHHLVGHKDSRLRAIGEQILARR